MRDSYFGFYPSTDRTSEARRGEGGLSSPPRIVMVFPLGQRSENNAILFQRSFIFDRNSC